MPVTFRIRRDTAANWASVNPVLSLGEPGIETNTRRIKYGDGVTAWSALGYALADPYATITIAQGGTGATTATAARTALGLGTAATRNTGTSGTAIPLLNTANTWSANQVFSASVIISASSPPATATASGTAGQVTWDANYLYVCVATNSWKRTALSAW